MLRRVLIALGILVTACFPISIMSPSFGDVGDGSTIYLGKIGPGQTVSILINPIVKSGGVNGIGGTYDYAVARGLPEGWTSSQSKLYQNPLQITITADPDAVPGNYSAQISVIDEYDGEKLGNVTFNIQVDITYDVMDFLVEPERLETGPGQPAKFDIIIENTGSTSDVFEVSATGAKRWELRKQVFVPAYSSRSIPYEIAGEEEETYNAKISVVSLASSKIHDEQDIVLNIKSSLVGDYKATNNGIVIFPIYLMPIYSLAGLISNLL